MNPGLTAWSLSQSRKSLKYAIKLQQNASHRYASTEWHACITHNSTSASPNDEPWQATPISRT